MKRRLNYTGRARIRQELITINLIRAGNGTVESFKAIIDLKGLGLPGTAKVFIEAYHRTEQQRYDFGTVGKIVVPDDISLSNLGYAENLKFRILIVDDNGKILASADRVKPVNEAKEPLLPVYIDDLGKKVWCIAYTDADGAPILRLNKNIPEIKDISRTPKFFFHIYPAVLHEILTHIVFIDTLEDQEDPETEWHKNWLNFATLILGRKPPNLCKGDDFDEEEVEKWIEDVTTEFCNSKSNWNEFTESIRKMVSVND